MTAERLKRVVEAPIIMSLNTARVESGLTALRARIASSGGSSAMNVVINVDDVTQKIAQIQQRIRSGLTSAAIDVTINGANAIAQASSIRARLMGILAVPINVTLNAATVLGDISTLRSRIIAQIGVIEAELRISLPATLTDMLTNLRALVLRLTRAVSLLRRSLNPPPIPPIPPPPPIPPLPPSGGAGGTGGLLSNLKGIAAAYLSIAGAQKLLGATIGGAMQQQKMMDMFVARTGDAEVGTAMFDKFKKEALAAGQDVNESLKGTLSFFSTTQNTDQLSQLNGLAARMAAFDSAGNGIEGAAFALKEAMSGDIVSLAERFNMSKTDIRAFNIDELGKAGDMDGFIKAFNQLLEKQKMGEDAFNTMLKSPAKQAEVLGNNIKSAMADAGGSAVAALLPLITLLNTAFQEGKFQPFFDALSTGLAWATSLVVGLVKAAMWLSETIQTYWPEISAVLAGIGAVIAMIVIPGLWAMIPPLWAALPPLYAQAAAWLAINWPILLIGLAIIGLILILQKCGVSFEQVLGFIGGLFMTLYGVIYNQIALIWNIFASLAEFLINVFIDPTYAVQKLVYDLAKTFGNHMVNMLRSAEEFAGGFMKTILDGINGVLKGFNWLSKKIESMTGVSLGEVDPFETDNLNIMSDSLQSMIDKLEEPVSTKNVVKIDRMQEKNLKDQFDIGYKGGASVAKALDVSALSKAINPDSLNKWNSGLTPNVGSVDEVKKVKGKVDISNEDLKVMRELAEMKNIQNFVTLTPSVNLTHNGDIRNEADIRKIITGVKVYMEEEMSSSAKGLYA